MRIFRLRPEFFILGAEKGGTTAVYEYLSQHPQIDSPDTKETCYFHKDSLYARGQSFYQGFFRRRTAWSKQQSFDATPAYLYYPAVAGRIRADYPDARFVICLRDPVSRAHSSMNMFLQLRRDNIDYVLNRVKDSNPNERKALTALYTQSDNIRDFRQLVEFEQRVIAESEWSLEPSYLRRGLYHRQLVHWFGFFERSRFHIMEQRELQADPAGCMNRLCRFLGIDDGFFTGKKLERVHAREYEAPLPDDLRSELAAFYRDENERLYALLGQRYDWTTA